jgi:hypothetical protein
MNEYYHILFLMSINIVKKITEFFTPFRIVRILNAYSLETNSTREIISNKISDVNEENNSLTTNIVIIIVFFMQINSIKNIFFLTLPIHTRLFTLYKQLI